MPETTTRKPIVKRRLPIKNTGVLPDVQDKKDWIAGEVSGLKYVVRIEDGNWGRDKWMPGPEKQKFYEDTFGCTGYSLENSVSFQINRMIDLGMIEIKPIQAWLDKDGKFNGNDAILNTMAGNTRRGNAMKNPLEVLRTKGLAPQSARALPPEPITWEKFHASVTDSERIAALKFFDYFDVAYERIPTRLHKDGMSYITIENVRKYLKQAPLWVAMGWCPGWSGGNIVQACDEPVSHATVIYNENQLKDFMEVFDSYPPFTKRIADDYKVLYAYSVVITPKESILKRKTMKTTLYQFMDREPVVYELWEDGLYYEISEEDYVNRKYGGWDKVEVKKLETIADEKIGGVVGLVGINGETKTSPVEYASTPKNNPWYKFWSNN